MAKKQANPAEATEKPAPAAAEAAPAEKPKKQREPKVPKEAKEAKAPKERKGKASPEAPPAEKPPAPVPAAEGAPAAPAAPATPAAVEPSGKKKGRPGRSPRRGKKLRNLIKNAMQKIAKESPAPLRKAIQLLKQLKRAKFDETVEIHLALGIDVSQSDQMIRGSVPLPHGLGKVKRVVVFTHGENVTKAKGAGAELARGDELLNTVRQNGWLD